jgi:hypothetical protein
MFELIDTWLKSNRDYWIGVELYNRFGDDLFLKSMFEEGFDDYNAERLVEELETLKKGILNRTIAPVFSAEHKPKNTKLPSESDDAPEPVVQKRNRRKYLYATSRDAHSRLKALAKMPEQREERAKLASLILDNFDEIKPLWDYTNHYDEYRELPKHTESVEVNLETLDVVTLNKTYLTDYKYIMKFKNDPKKVELVKARINRINQIQTILEKEDAFLHAGLIVPSI